MGAASLIMNQPGVYLVDVDGNAITVTDGLAIGSAEALIIAGKDGANARFVRVAADGTVRTDPTGTTTQPVSAASLPLPVGAATETTQLLQATAALQTQPGVDIGDVTVNNAAGASAVNIQDGGNSITVDTPQLPAALVGARLDVNAGAWLGSTAPTVGQKTMANSLPMVMASDQSSIGTKISDTLGNTITAFPATFLRVTDEPTQIFYDPFDAALDTAARWNAAVASGGGVAASVAAGNLTLATGTTANGYSYLQSQASFTPTVPAWLGFSFALKIPNPVVTGQYLFWGLGTNPGTPTSVAPLTDAVGFELATDGKMYAVVYAAGVRTAVQDLSATGNNKQPADSNLHRYIIYYRTDRTFFYIDSLDSNQLVASTSFVSPTMQVLPMKLLAIAAATPPASSGVLTVAGLAVWDTGKNNHTLSDGVYGWRKATIKPASTPPIASDPALVVVLSPNQQAIPVTNSPSSAATGIIYGEVTTAAVTNVALRKTAYTEQASNAARSVSSSSALDTSAGTGARTLRITYYTATFTGPHTTDVILNGTTAVATSVSDICYIEKIDVLTVGSGGSNVGTITLFVNNAGAGGTIGTIAIGDNRTLWAHHYVPTGKTTYITGLTGNNNHSSNVTLYMIKTKDLGVAAAPEQHASDTLAEGGGTAQTTRVYSTPHKVPGPARITVFGAPAGTPTIISRAGFDYYEQ